MLPLLMAASSSSFSAQIRVTVRLAGLALIVISFWAAHGLGYADSQTAPDISLPGRKRSRVLAANQVGID
jgi:hypothetical protein